MKVQQIRLDDNNPEHRQLSIYRTGLINRVRLDDREYRVYGTLELSAHDYAALFHYSIIEALNQLPFISETSNGLDSWDEAFLHNSRLGTMQKIIAEKSASINPEKKEMILLGWHDQPLRVAYLREIEPARFLLFLENLTRFVAESEKEGYDLEFIL